MTIRVILIDDHAKVHLAFSKLISLIEDIELVAQGNSGQEAIELCEEYHPDVLILDVIMPEMSGIAACQQMLIRFPQIKVIALSGFQDKESIQAMLEAGASGYVLKTSDSSDLANTIRTAYEGKSVLSHDVLQTLLKLPNAKNPRIDYGLTRREIDILRCLVDGKTNPEIADEMFVSLSTVKFHVSNVLQKLNVSTRTEAVSLAVEQNLAD